MKNMRMLARNTLSALLFAVVVLTAGVVWCGEKPAVEGFVGVPWGASRLQVASVMREKGFTLITNRVAGFYDADLYRGSFADHGANLYFHYDGKDSFSSGEAFLLTVQGHNFDVAMSGYYDLTSLLKAKYGPFEQESIGEGWRLCRWDNLPTKGASPAKAEIEVQGGRIPDYSGKNEQLYGVWVQYRYRQMKDI